MPYAIQVNDSVVDRRIDHTHAWNTYAIVKAAVIAVSVSQVFAEPVTVTLTGGPTSDERGIIATEAIS